MGSFRLATSTLHFHRTFNFTEMMLETVGKQLLHSCTSAINRQGISLPLDPQSQGRRLMGIIKQFQKEIFIYHSITGQESDLILHLYDLAKSCVFVKQSLPSAFRLFYTILLYKNTLSPEVTESICRVPSTSLFQPPQYTLPVHQCQIRYDHKTQILEQQNHSFPDKN